MNLRLHTFLYLLAHAVNEGIRIGLFDPAAPNGDPRMARNSIRFDAPLSSIPMRVWMSDWRFDEARIVVAAWPMPEVERWIESNAKGVTGDVTASGYLERRNGRLKVANPFEPCVFIRQNRRASLMTLPKLCDATDRLQLYLRFASAV